MAQLSDKDRAIVLAKLKLGGRPIEVSEETGVSYGTVARLASELRKAEESGTLLELMRVDQATYEGLIDTVRTELKDIPGSDVALDTLQTNLEGAKALDSNLTRVANVLVNRICVQIATAEHADTLLVLSEALAKIQTAFFAKGVNVNVNTGQQQFGGILRD